jgi:hypothetical protein
MLGNKIVSISTQGHFNRLVSNPRTIVVREAAPLTTSYVPSDSFYIEGANQLQLMVSFTKGEFNGCRLKIEYSEDEQNWFQETSVSVYGETNEAKHELVVRSIDSSANALISIPVWTRYFRVSAAAVDSGEDTSLSITAIAGNIYTGFDIIDT